MYHARNFNTTITNLRMYCNYSSPNKSELTMTAAPPLYYTHTCTAGTSTTRSAHWHHRQNVLKDRYHKLTQRTVRLQHTVVGELLTCHLELPALPLVLELPLATIVPVTLECKQLLAMATNSTSHCHDIS